MRRQDRITLFGEDLPFLQSMNCSCFHPKRCTSSYVQVAKVDESVVVQNLMQGERKLSPDGANLIATFPLFQQLFLPCLQCMKRICKYTSRHKYIYYYFMGTKRNVAKYICSYRVFFKIKTKEEQNFC